MKVDLPAITPVDAPKETLALIEQIGKLTVEAEESSFDIMLDQMRIDMTAQEIPKPLIDKCVATFVDQVLPYTREMRQAHYLKNYTHQQLQTMLDFYAKNPWFFEINCRTSYELGKQVADVAGNVMKQVILNDPHFDELFEREFGMADANTTETLSADDPRRNLENATSIALTPFFDNDGEFEKGVAVIDHNGKHQHNCGCLDCHPSDCICKYCDQ